MKCLSKDRNGNNCRTTHLCDSRFCKNHQYMNNYTDIMLEALQLCKGCKKMYWFEGDIKTCDKCRDRGKETRQEASINVIKCGKEGCDNKRSIENAYCGLHQVCLFVDETAALGKKLCRNYVRGCRTQLDADYERVRCPDCLEKERERDKAKRSVVSTEIVDGRKQCSVCCGFKPVEEYVGANNQETKTCAHCRSEFIKQNEKRDKEHVRELDRKNSKKPERIATKNEWIENNYEKVALKWMNYRQRKIEENGTEAYLKKVSDYVKLWRDNNPEKVKEMNEDRVQNLPYKYDEYRRKSENYRQCFELSYEEFESIVKMPCYYCGIIQDKGFNGIDRQDQQSGYTLTNSVSCCRMCNFMKGAVDNITFLHRIEHILTHNSLIVDGKHYPDAFHSHIGQSYIKYKLGAEKRNYTFEITFEEYNKLIMENCYICGKPSDETHKNGIDRFDNDIGYTTENVNACCGQCNYMKKDIEYDVFLYQLQKIYECSSKKEMINPSICIVNMLTPNVNKKTKVELVEEAKLRKQKQREELRARYGDEEYKKMRAAELAKYRAEKKKNKDV